MILSSNKRKRHLKELVNVLCTTSGFKVTQSSHANFEREHCWKLNFSSFLTLKGSSLSQTILAASQRWHNAVHPACTLMRAFYL